MEDVAMYRRLIALVVGLAPALVLVLALGGSTTQAQDVPAYIPVQGMLTADDGTPRDGMFVLEMRLYGLATGGVAFYAESQTVSIDQGLFTVYLGDGMRADLGDGSVSEAFDIAMFKDRPQGVVFLGITLEGTEMAPRLQLGSVPFAAFSYAAGDAQTVGGKPASAFQPLMSESCPTDQAVVGINADGTLMCAAHAGPKGDSGTDGKDGTTYAPGGGLSLNASNQLSVNFAGSGSATTAARSDHSHATPTPKYYGADSDDVGSTTTGRHSYCFLTRVRFDSDGGGDRWCEVVPNTATGTWTLTARPGIGQRTRCSIYCL